MSFSSTILHKTIFGHRRVHWGTWTSPSGVEGGDINTGLYRVEMCLIEHKGASVEADVAVINETFPLAGKSVTIVASSGDTGYWVAIGFGKTD